MDGSTTAERRQDEVELLHAMYPSQIHFDPQTYELKYTASSRGTVVFRVPDSYPESGLPDVISAVDDQRTDVRAKTKAKIDETKLPAGEEVLDAMIQAFEDVLAVSIQTNDVVCVSRETQQLRETTGGKYKVVVVWLHHLLNTNKRKLALNPTFNTATDGGKVSGITKPGYPGILVYSGPAILVDSHVAELKQQRWQAFQIRYEEEVDCSKCWSFGQGAGIVEVENMSDVVQGINGETNKASFLKAAGVK